MPNNNFNALLYGTITLQNAQELAGNDALLGLLLNVGSLIGVLYLINALSKSSFNILPVSNIATRLTNNITKEFNFNKTTNSLDSPKTDFASRLTNDVTKEFNIENPINKLSTTNLTNTASGIGGGLVGSLGGLAIGNLLFDTNSKGGSFVTGTLGLISSSVGSAAASSLASTGSVSLSSLGSASSLGQGAMGITNIALDTLDPVKKSKGENIAGLGLGALGTAAALASVPGLGWAAGGALLTTNMLGHMFGKKSASFTIDNDTFSKVGLSYGGSWDKAKEAQAKSNTKFSMWNPHRLNSTNDFISEAHNEQDNIKYISDISDIRRLLTQSMSNINSNRLAFNMQGRYDQQFISVGKKGMKIIDRARNILKKYKELQTNLLQKGGLISSTIEIVNPIEQFQEGGTIIEINNPQRNLQELINYAKLTNPRFILRLSEPSKGIEFIDDNGVKARGSHYLEWSTDDEGNAIVYPRIQEVDKELKFFNSKDAYKRSIETNNYLVMTPEEAKIFFAEDSKYGVAYKSGWPEFFEKFLKGGSVNVIPEGALHARKHNMDMDGITKKGIPVISEDEDGKIQQLAEIERNEVILRLEVTKKLEELCKKFYEEENKDEIALEAGKLLVYELLENTIDNTGLLKEV